MGRPGMALHAPLAPIQAFLLPSCLTTRRAGAYLKPHARGQRRPRDLRVRALDPDHFTCPAPAHGAVHQQRPGGSPAEGHASIILETPQAPSPPLPTSPPAPPPSLFRDSTAGAVGSARHGTQRGPGGGTASVKAAEAASEAAEIAAAKMAKAAITAADGEGVQPGTVPGMHEMYHLDAPSLGGFEEAVAAAVRALGALLSCVGGDCGGSGGGDGGGGRPETQLGVLCTSEVPLPPPGVASLLLGVDGISAGVGGGGKIVETIADVRDSFRELLVTAAALGVAVPCAPEGAGMS